MIAKEEALSSNEIVSPFARQIIQNLQYQGNRNDCAPFTAATLIRALCANPLDPIQLAEEMNQPAWRGAVLVIRRIPNWATFPWGLVDVLRHYGLPANWRIRVQPTELIHHLSTPTLYLPILLSWRPLWAHVMTLVAYHPQQGFGFANTQFSQQTIDWIPQSRFLSLWKASLRCTIIVNPSGAA